MSWNLIHTVSLFKSYKKIFNLGKKKIKELKKKKQAGLAQPKVKFNF